MQNLLSQPDPTLLPAEPDASAALDGAKDVAGAKQVAAHFPTYSAAWARLAESALDEHEPDPLPRRRRPAPPSPLATRPGKHWRGSR